MSLLGAEVAHFNVAFIDDRICAVNLPCRRYENINIQSFLVQNKVII